VEEVPEQLRPGSRVDEVMSREGGSVNVEEPLEALLGSETLQRLGAIMAVDRDGVLRGVVTVDQVRRALTAALPQRLA
ncbi:MAG: CBS domain-containing protein, partial [Actinomycetota bacterium]|nr:CBS domain-containing protein [Actinomycetota bacterium]